MPNFTQANRPISVDTPLGTDVLLLEKIQGIEAISELFEYQLDLLAENPIDFDQLLGLPATVTLNLPNNSGRQIAGIFTEVRKGASVAGVKGGTVLYRYRAVLSPTAWLLTRRVQSRIFQERSVPDILFAVFRDEWQLRVELRLVGNYPLRNYCVQYDESDWACACRLMEHEGISYFFRHDDKGEHLVLADHAGGYASLPQFAVVEYDEKEGVLRKAPVVREWERSQKLGTYRQTLRDYHFEKPTHNLSAERNAGGPVLAGTIAHPLDMQRSVNDVSMLEVYQYPGRLAHHHDGVARDGSDRPGDLETIRDDLERTVKIRHEAESTAQLRIRGAGDGGHFAVGHLFQLARHFDSTAPLSDNDWYLLTRVESNASVEGAYTTDVNAKPVYSNRFECLPAKWPLRPRRVTPLPRIEGPQTAVVVGPKDEEVYVDKFGRVKVHFHWDREKHAGGDSSCWVRVAQFWAGKGWGAFFWPRIGHEVVVAYEDGDPDRPLIVGSVYNAANMPPLDLPTYVSITGVKSCIYGGDPNKNFNSILFYDTPGKEFVHIHSEKNERYHSEKHKFHYVSGMSLSFHGDS